MTGWPRFGHAHFRQKLFPSHRWLGFGTLAGGLCLLTALACQQPGPTAGPAGQAPTENAPMSIELTPAEITIGQPAVVRVRVSGGRLDAPLDVVLAGGPPPGMHMERDREGFYLEGTPQRVGRYPINATLSDGQSRRSIDLILTVSWSKTPKTQPSSRVPY